MEHLLNMLVGGAIAACVGLSWVPAHAETLSPTSSQQTAEVVCKTFNSTIPCRLTTRTITLTVDIGGRDSYDAALELGKDKAVHCGHMYAKMMGYHFSEGWRFNYDAPDGVTLVSCPLDNY